jgi:hypothetical protein
VADRFDPYYTWLGIPPREQPANYYRLLSLELFEDNPDVISNAADRQMLHVRTFQSGPHAALSQKVLNDLAAARGCLLDPQEKADYDRQLAARRSAEASLAGPPPIPSSAGTGPVGEQPIAPPPRAALPPAAPSARRSATSSAVAGPPPVPTSTSEEGAPPPVKPNGGPILYGRRRRRRSLAPVLFGLSCLLVLAAVAGIALTYSSGSLSAPAEQQAGQSGTAATSGAGESASRAGGRSSNATNTAIVPSRRNLDVGGKVSKESPNPGGDGDIPFTVGVGAGEGPRGDLDSAEGAERVEIALPTPSAAGDETTLEAGPPPKDATPPTEEPAADKPARRAIPKGDALVAAQSEFEDRYASLVAKVNTPREKSALADMLLKDAADTRVTADTRHVMLRAAYRHAIDAGDYGNARRAVDALIADYDVDENEMRSQLFLDAAEKARTPTVYRDIVLASLNEIPNLLELRRFEQARTLAEEAQSIATKQLRNQPDQVDLRQRAENAEKEVGRQFALWNKAETARKSLLETADDGEARLVLGRYLCGFAGDWTAGLDHLARADDERWRTAAMRDLAGPTTTKEQLKVADAWYELGIRARDFPGLLARARLWYQQAQSTATSKQQAHIKKRLDDLLARGIDARHLAMATLPSSVTAGTRKADKPAAMAEEKEKTAATDSMVSRMRVSISRRDTLRGHTAAVSGLAFSPDGAKLAAVDKEATLSLWDVGETPGAPARASTRKSPIQIKAHDTHATGVVFARETLLLATAGDRRGKKIVSLWDSLLASRGVLDGHSSALLHPVFLPGDKSLAVATGDHFVKSFDTEGEPQRVFHSHYAPVTAITVSPRGDLLASADEAGQVRLYDLAHGEPSHSIDAHGAPIVSLAISPNGKRLASATAGGEVVIHDTTTAHRVVAFEAGPLASMVFLADGLGLAIGGDEQFSVWDARHGTQRAKLSTHTGMIRAIALSTDGRSLATGDDAGVIKLWNVTRSRPE